METKLEIAKNWLPRYTGMPLEQFGEYILITNFKDYVTKFAERFSSEIYGEGKAMQASTNKDGLTIINYGIGSHSDPTSLYAKRSSSPRETGRVVRQTSACVTPQALHPGDSHPTRAHPRPSYLSRLTI